MAAPAQSGDIYARWLGITETARPLNHYQLLRLKNFEDDAGQIRAHYNKMSAHIRKYLTTEYAEKAHGILNELTRAMLCLTDSRRKSDYDASLGRSSVGESKKRTFEQILIGRKLVNAEQLAKAKSLAAAIGVELRDALMQQKVASAEALAQALAESQGLPYVDLLQATFDIDLLGKMPATLARQHSAVPLMIDNDRILVASPNPLSTEIEDQLRLRLGLMVRPVICTPAAIHEIVNRYYTREAAAKEMGVTSQAAKDADEEFDPVAAAAKKKERLKLTGIAFALGFAFVAVSLNFVGLFSINVQRKLASTSLLYQYAGAAVVAIIPALVTFFVKRK